MRDVKVNKDELLTAVKKNREKHIREYSEAVAGYKSQTIAAINEVMQRLSRRVEELKAGEILSLHSVTFSLQVPENHAKDYDQVIRMLEMSVDKELTIRSDEFACYVMDDWGWREDFEVTKARYSSASSSSGSASSSSASSFSIQ